MGWSSCTVRLYKGKNKNVDDKKTGGKKLDEISYITKRKKKKRESGTSSLLKMFHQKVRVLDT